MSTALHPESFKFKTAVFVLCMYMLTELAVGRTFHCLVLIADAYHVFSDQGQFVIQLYMKKSLGSRARPTGRFSFGLGRSEYLSSLLNGVVLSTLCFTLALESLQRLYSPEDITMAPIVMGVGLFGITWNLTIIRVFRDGGHSHAESLGLAHPRTYARRMFQAAMRAKEEEETTTRMLHPGHSHSHDHRYSHDHSHDPSHDHSHVNEKTQRQAEQGHDIVKSYKRWISHDERPMLGHQHDHDHDHEHSDEHDHSHSEGERSHGDGEEAHAHSDNKAIIADAAGDLAGNLAVVVDALLFWLFGPNDPEHFSGVLRPTAGIGYVDPLLSVIVICVVMHHALPLVLGPAFALLQGIDSRKPFFLERDLLHEVQNLTRNGIENLRMWTMRDDTPVVSMTLHVHATTADEIEQARAEARQVLKRWQCAKQSTIEIIADRGPRDEEHRRGLPERYERIRENRFEEHHH